MRLYDGGIAIGLVFMFVVILSLAVVHDYEILAEDEEQVIQDLLRENAILRAKMENENE